MREKIREYFWLYNKWICLKNSHMHISSHPAVKNANLVSVYGLGEIGKRLIEELESDGVQIQYAVDKNAEKLFADFGLYTDSEEVPETDILIVTPICDFEAIKKNMEVKTKGKIISLEEIVDYLWEKRWTEE